jgi:hypothetical protein
MRLDCPLSTNRDQLRKDKHRPAFTQLKAASFVYNPVSGNAYAGQHPRQPRLMRLPLHRKAARVFVPGIRTLHADLRRAAPVNTGTRAIPSLDRCR